MSDIAVIGGGAWGTGLAIMLGRKGRHLVRIWAYEKDVCESINERHENDVFLPGQHIPESVLATNHLPEALRGAEIVVSVMPSHHVRQVFRAMQPHLRPEMLFVSATKGLENETLLRPTEVVKEVLGIRARDGFDPRIGALSGPSLRRRSPAAIPPP
jgi:glycerol-3-phosphate dehydrogenase (NAD(P)+)